MFKLLHSLSKVYFSKVGSLNTKALGNLTPHRYIRVYQVRQNESPSVCSERNVKIISSSFDLFFSSSFLFL